MGYFDSGFAPTATNTAQWSEHWTTLDRTIYFENSSRFFSTFSNDGAATGQEAYIWGLNRSARNNEWILMRDSSWTVPFAGGVSPTINWGAGDASIVVVGAVNEGGIHLQTAEVDGEPPFLDFADWQELHFTEAEVQAGTTVDPDADADGDGVSNAVEYALGSIPNSGSSLPSLEQSFDDNGRAVVTARFARQVNATLEPEVSSDLVTWSSGSSVQVLSTSGAELVFRDNSAGATRFARIQVTLP